MAATIAPRHRGRALIEVRADEVRPGDEFYSLGPGYVGRTVRSVVTRCNCRHASGTLDENRARRHYPVTLIVAGDLHAYVPEASSVWIAERS